MRPQDLLRLADELADLSKTPADSEVIADHGEVGSVYAGIDITAQDLMQRPSPATTYLSHHPPGRCLGPGFFTVLRNYSAYFQTLGVPAGLADRTTADIIAMWRQIPRIDPDRSPAEAIGSLTHGLNLLNIHLAADRLAKRLIEQRLASLGPDDPLSRIPERLSSFGEFAHTREPYDLRCGDWANRLGRWVFCHACGGNGGPFAARLLFEHGFDTVIFITWFRWQIERFGPTVAGRPGQNLLIIPHLASDSLGMNVVLRALSDQGIEVERKPDLLIGNGVPKQS